tara:strand:+ start:70 stop:537 length:468 start_codon:yes stop_codon:yes gene_type:complete
MAFLAPAAPFITAATSVMAASQAGAVGKYNEAIKNRNALVYEQEKERLEDKLNFDLARFDDQFRQFQGKTTTAILTSGAELSGSGLRIKRSNAEQAVIEKNVMEYNTKVAASQAEEKANFARVQGKLARIEARQAQFGYLAGAGTSLLSSGVFES